MSAAPGRRTEPRWIRLVLTCIALAFFVLLLAVPLSFVVWSGLARGLAVWAAAVSRPDTVTAIRQTLTIVAWVVPLNTLFGLMAAYAISKFHFRGKTVLTALIDLPFAVSPVIAGSIFVFLLGRFTPLGGWLEAHGITVIFATPGMVLATTFVTFPFVARELIPLMQAQGTEDELAARSLGASGWQSFWRVTLPNIRWSLLFGVVLCAARAMGEFGAVSVVSAHVSGETNTLPLQVEALYDGLDVTSAFAVSSILVLMAMLTLVVKAAVEWSYRRQQAKEQA
jgi:sulfate/thiosulfate transport system permease protein